jgi:hypothetical protein
VTALSPDPSPQPGGGNPAAELLAFLRAAGFSVRAAGDKVVVNPGGQLSDAERERVAALKPGLLAVLAEEQWKQCDLCPARVDCGSPADVGRVCWVPTCPYRQRERRKR